MGQLPHGRNIPPWETLAGHPLPHAVEQERRCLQALYEVTTYTYISGGTREE